MKFLTKFFILTIAISMIAIGCKKENQEIINENEIDKELKESGPEMRHIQCLYYYDPFTGTQYVVPIGCFWPPTNCLPTVTIYDAIDGSEPNQEAIALAYTNFTSAYENGNVEHFFQTDQYLTLFPSLSSFPNVLSGLINSEIIIHHSVGEDGLDYYICLPESVNYNSEWIGQEECVFVIDNQID